MSAETGGASWREAQRRQWPLLTVSRLGEDRRVELIRRILRLHSKRLNEKQVRWRVGCWSDHV